MSVTVPKTPGHIEPLFVSLLDAENQPRSGEAAHLSARILQSETGYQFDQFDNKFRLNPAEGDIAFTETTLLGTYKAMIPVGDHFPLGSYFARISHAETGEQWEAGLRVAEPGDGMAADIENLKNRLGTFGSGVIRIVTPIVQGADIQIVAGDDYTEAAGREIVIESDTWPSLAGASVVLHGTNVDTGDQLLDAHTVTIIKADPDESGPARISFELASSLTSTFPVGRRAVAVSFKATLDNAQIVTLARGFLTVQSSPDLA